MDKRIVASACRRGAIKPRKMLIANEQTPHIMQNRSVSKLRSNFRSGDDILGKSKEAEVESTPMVRLDAPHLPREEDKYQVRQNSRGQYRPQFFLPITSSATASEAGMGYSIDKSQSPILL